VLRPGRKPHWASFSFVQLFRGIFFKALGTHLSRKTKKRDVPGIQCIPLLMHWEWSLQFANFWWLSRTPGHLTHNQSKNTSIHESVKEHLYLSISGRISSQSPQPSLFWHLGRHQLQGWYFPPQIYLLVCPMLSFIFLKPIQKIFDIYSLSDKNFVLIAE